MTISICFIVHKIWNNRQSIQTAFNWKCFTILLPYALAIAGNIVISAIVYKNLLETMAGGAVERTCIEKYVRANLYKYMPGNVMHYVGRNEIAAEGIVSFKQVNAASVIEILASVIAASTITLLFAGQYVFQYLRQFEVSRWIIWGIVALCVVALIAVVILRKRLAQSWEKMWNPKIFCAAGKMIAICIAWNFVGNLLFACLLGALGCEIAFTDYFPIIGMYSGAWIVGFITPGVPGGIGVREAMLNLFLSGLIPAWAVSLAGVLIRVAQIIGELLAYAVVAIVIKRRELR